MRAIRGHAREGSCRTLRGLRKLCRAEIGRGARLANMGETRARIRRPAELSVIDREPPDIREKIVLPLISQFAHVILILTRFSDDEVRSSDRSEFAVRGGLRRN